jgi:ADP-ribosylglycohydrolase
MGAPVEGWSYERIVSEKGYIDDFEGGGTDDSIIKLILCEALIKNGGYATADDFAESFLRHSGDYGWFFIPVRNMFHKIQDEHSLPIEAGRDNMASSSSAMSIAPIGIVNACDPRSAASEAYEAASLIHTGCCNFCRDAASIIAAAVAEAFRPDSTIESILEASTKYLHIKSAGIMRDRVADTLALARESGGFDVFRKRYYESVFMYNTMCDSRETVPVALSAFLLSGGDAAKAIEYGVNFGRDADTIATMAGAIAGAHTGINGFKREWVDKVLSGNDRHDKLAGDMTDLIIKRCNDKTEVLASIKSI